MCWIDKQKRLTSSTSSWRDDDGDPYDDDDDDDDNGGDEDVVFVSHRQIYLNFGPIPNYISIHVYLADCAEFANHTHTPNNNATATAISSRQRYRRHQANKVLCLLRSGNYGYIAKVFGFNLVLCLCIRVHVWIRSKLRVKWNELFNFCCHSHFHYPHTGSTIYVRIHTTHTWPVVWSDLCAMQITMTLGHITLPFVGPYCMCGQRYCVSPPSATMRGNKG